MSVQAQVEAFLSGEAFAVVGASTNREKYGNKVLRAYQQNHLNAVPIHPTEQEIEGTAALSNLAELEHPVHGISIITPPVVTEQVVREAIDLGIKHIWMQPGAESETATRLAEEAHINVIPGNACLLVALRYHE